MVSATGLESIVGSAALDSAVAPDHEPLGRAPELVVSPADTSEVVEVMRWAGAEGVTVVPVGTGLHLEPDPQTGPYLLLSTHRMAEVLIYEAADLTLTAQAGMRVSAVAELLAPQRQWLPFDPPDAAARTLGGLIASGRTGPIGAGYGDLRNHVLGATVVCGDGRVLRLGGRVVKNVAGFDLLRPVVGSRGALGVIVTTTLRVFPTPEVDRTLVFETSRLDEALGAARATATAPVLPASIVLSGRTGSYRLAVRLHGSGDTVAADLETLRKATGVALDDAGPAGPESEDSGSAMEDGLGVRLRARPSRLGTLFEALGDSRFTADAYSGTVEATLAPDVEWDRLAAAVGSVDGTARVVRGGVRPVVGGPSERALGLAARVKSVFDPDAVLRGLPS